MFKIGRNGQVVIATILITGLVPVLALGAGASIDPQFKGFYHLSADVLDRIPDGAHMRFEYRSDDRFRSSHELALHIDRGGSLLVPIPPPIQTVASGVQDLELLVYVDDLLLAHFDADALSAYSRMIRHTHAEQLADMMASDLRSAPGSRVSARIGDCDSPCGGGCLLHQDYDCDGTINDFDNCWDDSNPDQADCDGDFAGDVCDVTDGIFQPTGPVETCMTDKDSQSAYFIFEHHVEQRLVDVSACNSPDRWNRWVRSQTTCVNVSESQCCEEGLETSIEQVGDDPDLWCSSNFRNQDFCH